MWRGSNFTSENYFGRLPFFTGQFLNIDIGNSIMAYNLSNEVKFYIIIHLEPNENNKKAYYEFKNQGLKLYIKNILEKN